MAPRSYMPLLAGACIVLAFLAGVAAAGHRLLPDSVLTAFGVDKQDAARAKLIDTVNDNYYKKVDRGKLNDASLKGIVDSLHDPFSHYFTPDETKAFNQSVHNPEFEGVGISVAQDKRGLRIVQVFDGSPAKAAGILKEDVITAVGGKSIAGEPSDVSTAKIKGKAGTHVKITVLTPTTKKQRDLDLARAKIDIPVAQGEMRKVGGKKIAYLQLFGFSDGASTELRGKLDPLIKQGAQGVVLDLRGNGGGLLREGVAVASTFVEDGLIVSTKGRNRAEVKYRAQGKAIDGKLPVVVLVDGGTASASEIVTGALRDHHRAEVVGTKTFGKGVFQEVEPLPNGGSLDLTVGSFYEPNGENLQHNGIDPMVRAKDDPHTTRDEGLPVALREVAKQIKTR
ncbi:MAG: carboxyl-terminal processing protease [Thermoleophilaceae bacterium]|nr:carboxyl-terminal processing protease [Thermoleophilaceae bacterium]